MRRGTTQLLAPLALIVVPFLILPAAFGAVATFTSYGPLEGRVRFVGLDDHIAILGDPQLGAAWRSVLVLMTVAVPAELVLGLLVAYLLREPFRGRSAVRIGLLLPWLVSPVASGVMWHFLLSPTVGLLEFGPVLFGLPAVPSPLGLSALPLPTAIAIDVWRKAPLVGFLLLPGVLAIPRERWETAALEGARLADRLRHVVVPPLVPLLLTVAMLLVGDTLGTFDSLLILTGGGPGSATLTPALLSYQLAFRQNDWRLGATASWLVAASVLLAGLAYVRLTRRGR